jgi:hypothetical protein
VEIFVRREFKRGHEYRERERHNSQKKKTAKLSPPLFLFVCLTPVFFFLFFASQGRKTNKKNKSRRAVTYFIDVAEHGMKLLIRCDC